MKRFFASMTLAASVATAAVAQEANTEDVKAAECELQSQMVMAVVDSRSSGSDPESAVEAVQGGLDGEAAKYASAVPAVVDWVYTLPEDKLGKGVADSWVEACVDR